MNENETPTADTVGIITNSKLTNVMNNIVSSAQEGNKNPSKLPVHPIIWYKAKYPELAAIYGEPLKIIRGARKSVAGGGYYVAGINEDFLAATLGSRGSPQEPIVFYAPENGFYQYQAEHGIYHPISEDEIKEMLSAVMLQCHRACQTHSCNSSELAFKRREEKNLWGVIKKAKAILKVEQDFFADDYTELLPCVNGVLRLRDRHLMQFEPQYQLRHKLSVPYRPKEKCNKFLDTLLDRALDLEDIELLQQWCGMLLTGKNHAQMLLILTGTAGGGKGTIVRVLHGILGTGNVGMLRTQLLETRFEIGRCSGKMLLYGSDVNEDFLNHRGASMIKSLIGGDPLNAEFKGSNKTPEMEGCFNMILTCNSHLKIKLQGDEEAWRRRLLIIELHKEKPKCPIYDLSEQILEHEASGVLNWMIEGYRKIRKNRMVIKLTSDQQKRVDDILLESASVEVFVRECIEEDSESQLTVEQMRAGYLSFCKKRGWRSVPEKEFSSRSEGAVVRELGLPKRHDIIDDIGNTRRGWKGIRLNNASAAKSQENTDTSDASLAIRNILNES
ncbi:MAG: hypothetical protein JXB38_02205 [Anaerolineales bacterium]|nr:hypothetical protein [Anaerolineales bacterium]